MLAPADAQGLALGVVRMLVGVLLGRYLFPAACLAIEVICAALTLEALAVGMEVK